MNKSELKKLLLARLEEERKDHDEHLLIVQSLKSQEGKKVTKHFQKHLPDGFKLKDGYNGLEIESPRQKTHYLCREEEKHEFSIEKFEDRNAPCNRGAKERAEKLETILNNDEELNKWFNHYNKIEKAIKLIKEIDSENSPGFTNPAHYDIITILSDRLMDGMYHGTKSEIEKVIR